MAAIMQIMPNSPAEMRAVARQLLDKAADIEGICLDLILCGEPPIQNVEKQMMVEGWRRDARNLISEAQ